MKIYLAMPITGRSYDEVVDYITKTRDYLLGYGYEVLNPMTGKGYLRNEVEFKAHGFDNPVSTNHAIFERDKWMVQNCDIIYLNFSNCNFRFAIGMTMELAWASLLGKHSVITLPEGNPHKHAFILEAADIIFATHEETMNYLVKLIKGDM